MENRNQRAINGPFYDILVRKMPAYCNHKGALQVAKLAKKLSMSQEGVYRWLRSNVISKRGLNNLIEVCRTVENLELLAGTNNPPLTLDDLSPFL